MVTIGCLSASNNLQVRSSSFELLPRHRLAGWNYEDSGGSGFKPMRSFTTLRKRCLQPKYRSVVCTETCPQQELNLLQFTTGLMANAGTRPTEVVRSEGRDPTVFCLLLHDARNDLGAESGAPDPSSLVDRTKERASYNAGGFRPGVNSSFHPIRDRDSPYVATACAITPSYSVCEVGKLFDCQILAGN
jgi:hypothetical protein